jgi:hypothetical protein
MGYLLSATGELAAKLQVAGLDESGGFPSLQAA